MAFVSLEGFGEDIEIMRVALGMEEIASAAQVISEMDEVGDEIGILRGAQKVRGTSD